MYGLFYHVNAPLMRGHVVNVDRIFWFTVPAKADTNHYFRDFISKMTTDKQRGHGPRFSAAGEMPNGPA